MLAMSSKKKLASSRFKVKVAASKTDATNDTEEEKTEVFGATQAINFEFGVAVRKEHELP